MQSPIKERVAKLRQEIAELTEANRLHLRSSMKAKDATADHQRRLQRLLEIRHQLLSLTDWKKT